MREAAEAQLSGYTRFHSIAAPAERTGLPKGSIDLITVAQAFHWFDPAAVLPEFRRIVRTGAHMALIWNTRLSSGSPFLEGYEDILRKHAPEYVSVGHKEFNPATLTPHFSGEMRIRRFPNDQRFDWDGLVGRLLSSSYTPTGRSQ